MIIEETCVEVIFEHSYLFEEYAEETKGALVPDVVPDKEKYLALEQAGVLHCVGVFDQVELVGFAVFYISEMLHYSENAATMESVFIQKKHRKFGTGAKLFAEVERLAREEECVNLFVSAPVKSALATVSKTMGFEPTNITYSKKL